MPKPKSLIEGYMEDAESMYIVAKDVEEGDLFEITGVTVESDEKKRFERPYVVVDVLKEKEELRVRLGPQNMRRVIKTLGTDEKEWVGNHLEVLTTQYYDGLKQTGILWRGVKAK